MIEATKIHSGQYKRYGDSFYVWEITTDEPEEKVIDYCFRELYKKDQPLPSKEEWSAAIKIGGEHARDMNYYFRGYYTLGKTEKGYKFTICEPYAD